MASRLWALSQTISCGIIGMTKSDILPDFHRFLSQKYIFLGKMAVHLKLYVMQTMHLEGEIYSAAIFSAGASLKA